MPSDAKHPTSNRAATVEGLQIEHGVRRFDAQWALNDVSLRLNAGEIGVLLGPSGCGKTTTLRIIAGLERLDSGTLMASGRVLQNETLRIAAEDRGIGLVFQDHALFPHLTVAGNIGFGLHRLTRDAQSQRIKEMLALTGLEGLGEAYPATLSGGQQQRVALARALAPQPSILLMDEPFASLDLRLRRNLARELRQLLKSLSITALIVTHDPEEAFALADRAGVMQQGRLLQWASPYDLYHQPVCRFVAEFVAPASFLPIERQGDGRWACELGPLPTDPDSVESLDPTAHEVMLRPDDIIHDDDSPTEARIVSRVFRGADFLYTLALPSGREVLAQVPSHHDHPVGSLLGIRLDLDHLIAF
jgi:iron(III) transport system ATP-binding protein